MTAIASDDEVILDVVMSLTAALRNPGPDGLRNPKAFIEAKIQSLKNAYPSNQKAVQRGVNKVIHAFAC